MIIPGNYVHGKVLLGWSSTFYLGWLRDARSLMTVRYGEDPPPFHDDRAIRESARASARISTRDLYTAERTNRTQTRPVMLLSARHVSFAPINPNDV